MEEGEECCMHTHCMSTLDAPMRSSAIMICQPACTHMYMYIRVRPDVRDRHLVVRMRGRGILRTYTHSNEPGSLLSPSPDL